MIASEDKKAIANAYEVMTSMPAWKELVQFIEAEKEHSINRLDVKPAKDVSVGDYCEERGYRKGLEKILQHAEYRKSGV